MVPVLIRPLKLLFRLVERYLMSYRGTKILVHRLSLTNCKTRALSKHSRAQICRLGTSSTAILSLRIGHSRARTSMETCVETTNEIRTTLALTSNTTRTGNTRDIITLSSKTVTISEGGSFSTITSDSTYRARLTMSSREGVPQRPRLLKELKVTDPGRTPLSFCLL